MKGWPTLADILGDTETEYWDRIIEHDADTCPRCNGARAWATLIGDKWPASKLCLDGIAQLAFADEPLPPPKRRKPTPNRKNKA